MTQEDIIRMAREAWNDAGEGWVVAGWFKDREKALERFAQKIAAAESEACAKICEHAESNWRKSWHSGAEVLAADAVKNCAEAIRARGQQ